MPSVQVHPSHQGNHSRHLWSKHVLPSLLYPCEWCVPELMRTNAYREFHLIGHFRCNGTLGMPKHSTYVYFLHFLITSWISALVRSANYKFCRIPEFCLWLSIYRSFSFYWTRKEIRSVVIWIRSSFKLHSSCFLQEWFMCNLLALRHVQYTEKTAQLSRFMVINEVSLQCSVDIQWQ